MINLQQLYNIGLSDHIDIFEGLTVPIECRVLDTETLKSVCFERCGLNIPVYPDPDTMRAAITLWSKKNSYTFIHVDKIMAAEYSPIENVFEDTDSERTFKGNTDRKDKTNTTNTPEVTHSVTDRLTNDVTSLQHGKKTELEHGKKVTESGSDDNNTTNLISAYDETASYSPDNKSENKITYGHTATDSGKDTSTNSGTDTTTRNYVKTVITSDTGNTKTDTDLTGNEKKDDLEIIKTSRHGNIGITSANKLQIEEYNMLKEYNPYNYLAELFERELTLYIY